MIGTTGTVDRDDVLVGDSRRMGKAKRRFAGPIRQVEQRLNEADVLRLTNSRSDQFETPEPVPLVPIHREPFDRIPLRSSPAVDSRNFTKADSPSFA